MKKIVIIIAICISVFLVGGCSNVSIILEERYSDEALNEQLKESIKSEKSDEGIYILQVIYEKYPKNDAFRNNLAWGYNEISKFNLANYYSDLALEVEPNESIEYVNKGNALYGLDKYKEALEAFKMAYSLNSPEATAVWGLAQSFEKLEKYDES